MPIKKSGNLNISAAKSVATKEKLQSFLSRDEY